MQPVVYENQSSFLNIPIGAKDVENQTNSDLNGRVDVVFGRAG
jgi:hypothetical protein